MNMQSLIMCPYLKGSTEGAHCHAADKHIKDMKDVNIKVCMGRHHEACSVYFCALQPAWDGKQNEPSLCAEM